MHFKVILVLAVLVIGAFFYLYTRNPAYVSFVITKDRTYTLPLVLLVFLSFLAGAVIVWLNTLVADTRRAVRGLKTRRAGKLGSRARHNYHRGVEALLRGDASGARAFIEKALDTMPGDPDMTISLAETYLKEDKPRAALRVLENGLAKNPDSAGMMDAIGGAALAAGDSARAEKAFTEAITMDAQNPFALGKLRDIRIEEGRWAEAATLQKRLMDCETEERIRERQARFLTGLLFEAARSYVAEERTDEAISKLKEPLKHDDTFIPAHVLTGEIYSIRGDADGAVKAWDKAYQRHPKSGVPLLLKMEELYIRQSEPEKMIERLRREVASNPGDVNLRVLLARLYSRLEMVDPAIEELERLHGEGHESAYTRALLGQACMRRDQAERAAELLLGALGFDVETLPGFSCLECKKTSMQWEPRCPECGVWNTMRMDLKG